MNGNLNNQQVPTEVLDQAKALLDQVTTLLLPYMVTLTSAERQAIPKMGDKTLAFVSKAQEYAGQYPNLLPVYVNKADLDVDVANATNLVGIKLQVDQLSSLIDDTAMVAGSEAYTAALAFYNTAKMASRQNVPGAKLIADELAARFIYKTRKVATN